MQTEFSRGDDDDLSYTRLFHHADITTLIHSFQPNVAHHLPVATTAAPARFTSALRITMPARVIPPSEPSDSHPTAVVRPQLSVCSLPFPDKVTMRTPPRSVHCPSDGYACFSPRLRTESITSVHGSSSRIRKAHRANGARRHGRRCSLIG